MNNLYDYGRWSIEDRARPEHNLLVLIGGKGMVHAYPNFSPKDPNYFYSKEEAYLNATVASFAPLMIRTLERLADHMRFEAEDNPVVELWRDEIVKVIAVAKGERPFE